MVSWLRARQPTPLPTAIERAEQASVRATAALERAQAARFAAWDAWWAALDTERKAAELVAVAEADVREVRAGEKL